MKQLVTILILTLMSTQTNAQTWLDTTLYPFENKYLRLEAGNMHYVDEGQGEVILFVHGTPTWSFLYRDFIRTLSKDYRCIAIDHLGFGLSDKPESFAGTPEAHSKNLSEFMKKLDLQRVTFVVHDFGGPIGLGAGIENAERIERVVLFNTWLWAVNEEKDAQKVDKIINSWMGKFLYLNMNFSPKVLLKKGFKDPKQLSKKVHQQYIQPFPDKASRQPLLTLGKSLVGSSDWYQGQWENLDKLTSKKWLILWGADDQFITLKYLQKWKERIPAATALEYSCGHFVQEEQTEESISAIANFMQQ
jgi:pimeloyl-ACP methyl ester carboxylesterase